jgi:hypothetical protein
MNQNGSKGDGKLIGFNAQSDYGNGHTHNNMTPTPKSSKEDAVASLMHQSTLPSSILHEAPKSKRILDPIQSNQYFSVP